ncbi:MAG: RNA-binding protein [Bacteroidota bacterium]|nr:RNA-binding protein [Bacteroidota bacterium]MDP4227576.1 RNA-binding protein [Bacteroidota bacterium]MDP4274319.1 RNA-binding protein [Bacteroidota bacterium]
MNIYVGNISYNSTEDNLKQIFEEYGEVTSVKIVKDKYSGRSKGFGFVEMANDEDGKRAIEELNGYNLLNREISVSEARPKAEGERNFNRNNYRRNNY